MNILSRYILREYGKLLLLCLSAFVFLYLLVDFIEQSNSFFKYNADGISILLYFAYKLPLILFQVIPASILLATLLSLSILSKNSEIIAMQAGGVSLYRIVAPLLVMAMLISGAAFVLNEYVVPFTTEKAEMIKRVEIKGKQPAVRHKRKRIWFKSPHGVYNIRLYYTLKKEMRGVSIYQLDSQFRLEKSIEAKSARWTGSKWEFEDGVLRTFDKNRFIEGTPFEKRIIDIPETPEDFSTVVKASDEMNYRELSELIDQVEGEGFDVTRYRVDLMGKIAFPLVSLIMALLAIPFALKSGRQGGIALGIAIAVTIGVLYWLVMGTFLSFGYSGQLPPWIAAWGSHALFAAIGIWLLVRTRK